MSHYAIMIEKYNLLALLHDETYLSASETANERPTDTVTTTK